MLLDAMQARRLFEGALENKFAVLAVNADSHAAVLDALEAARECEAPIIIETSLWQLQGRSFGAGDAVLGLARYLADLAVLANSERFAKVPVLFHTDHIKGPDTMRILEAAIRGVPFRFGNAEVPLRASTLSLDSSELSEEENIETLCALCRCAAENSVPVTLEMEAGVDDGLTPLKVTEKLLGSVEERYPGFIFLWAPGLGTRHGFSAEGYPAFSVEAVRSQAELAKRLTGRPIGIALHGSSGLPEENLRAAVAAGVVKVNWSSESLWIRSRAALEYFQTRSDRLEKGHAQFKVTAMDNGLQTFVAERYLPAVIERIRVLGGEGRAAILGS